VDARRLGRTGHEPAVAMFGAAASAEVAHEQMIFPMPVA
jgi:hypothetical protein